MKQSSAPPILKHGGEGWWHPISGRISWLGFLKPSLASILHLLFLLRTQFCHLFLLQPLSTFKGKCFFCCLPWWMVQEKTSYPNSLGKRETMQSRTGGEASLLVPFFGVLTLILGVFAHFLCQSSRAKSVLKESWEPVQILPRSEYRVLNSCFRLNSYSCRFCHLSPLLCSV